MSQADSLIETSDVRVRVMILPGGGKTAFHHHSEVTDHIICLSGVIRVCIRKPERAIRLDPGELFTVRANCIHQVANFDDQTPARYLLVQGVGTYDFIVDHT